MACKIELDSPDQFHLGSTITGSVICMLDQPKEFLQGIECTLNGKEETYFTSQIGSSVTHYSGSQTFLTDKIMLESARSIDAGSYKYPFSFTLPATGIPSSYNGSFGKVTYYIEGSVARENGTTYHGTTTITVTAPADLNVFSNNYQMSPVTYQIEESPKPCCCGLVAEIRLDMTLEKEAFLIGEVINVRLVIHNPTQMFSDKTTIALVSNTEFTTTHPHTKSHIENDVLSSLSDSGITGTRVKTYYFKLPINQLTAIPNLTGCTLIQQWFTVTATVFLEPCFKNVEMPVKIYIGQNFVSSPPTIGTMGVPQVPLMAAPGIVPVAQAPVNRPPYPVEDSHFPSPLNSNKASFLPSVHFPIRDISGNPIPMPRPLPLPGPGPSTRGPIVRNVPSAPLAEEEQALINPQEVNGRNHPVGPPSYEEATGNANTRN